MRLIARNLAAVAYDPYYTDKAQEMRELAMKTHSRLAKDKLLALALQYDTLAKAAQEPPSPPKQA